MVFHFASLEKTGILPLQRKCNVPLCEGRAQVFLFLSWHACWRERWLIHGRCVRMNTTDNSDCQNKNCYIWRENSSHIIGIVVFVLVSQSCMVIASTTSSPINCYYCTYFMYGIQCMLLYSINIALWNACLLTNCRFFPRKSCQQSWEQRSQPRIVFN